MKAIRKSKSFLHTKIHTVCDALGNPVGFHLITGQDSDLSDLEGAGVLVGAITKAKAVLADQAYAPDERVMHKLQDKGYTAAEKELT